MSEKHQFEMVEGVDSWGLFEIISNNCPLLEICNVSYCGPLNTAHIENLFKNSQRLRKLEIENHCFYDNMDRVVSFNITSQVKRRIYCSDFYDPEFFDEWTEVERIYCIFALSNFFTHVDLGNIEGLSNNTIVLIASKNCNTLVHLGIDLTSDPNWSLSSIVTVLAICEKLTKLELKDCGHLTNEDFKKLHSITPHKLSRLVINNSPFLQTDTLSRIMKHNAIDWEALENEYCPLVDDELLFESL
jgi:hypothetical protein